MGAPRANVGLVVSTRVASALAIALLAGAGAGCGRKDNEPVKVERNDPTDRSQRKTPFKDPKRDPPGPRKPAELDGEELDAHLERARALMDEGDSVRAMQMLYRCANRTPPSVRCDGELGMLLLEHRTRKAHADYFVAEAVRLDDPEVEDDFYRRLAQVARGRGRFAVALEAIERVIARGQPTAEDYVTLSHVLQSDRHRLTDAIAALEKAWEMKPEDPSWLHDRAALVAQTADVETAIALFEQYDALLDEDDPKKPRVAERIMELRMAVAPQAE
jgi:tetratricopeptide (TPR) repeat protein